MIIVPSLVTHVRMVSESSGAGAEEDDEPDGVGVVPVADAAVVTVGVVLEELPVAEDALEFMMARI
jgi:hypothetical protein